MARKSLRYFSLYAMARYREQRRIIDHSADLLDKDCRVLEIEIAAKKSVYTHCCGQGLNHPGLQLFLSLNKVTNSALWAKAQNRLQIRKLCPGWS